MIPLALGMFCGFVSPIVYAIYCEFSHTLFR